MPSINKVTIIGNITADTALKMTKNGKKVTNFTVATDEIWKKKDGETIKNTNFHKIVTWNGLADFASKIGGKGRLVYIEGKLVNRSYESDKNGTQHVTEVVATSLRALEPGKEPSLKDIPLEEIDVEVTECETV